MSHFLTGKVLSHREGIKPYDNKHHTKQHPVPMENFKGIKGGSARKLNRSVKAVERQHKTEENSRDRLR